MSAASAGTERVARAAARLQRAAAESLPCAPVRDLLGTGDLHADLAAAYAVQSLVLANGLEAAPAVPDSFPETGPDSADAAQNHHSNGIFGQGARRVGRKIGLTSEAVQRQLKVDQPDVGTLLNTMAIAEGGTVGAGRLIQPRIEAEIAFVLAADLTSANPSAAEVRAATSHVVAALEIVDSRIAGWDITILDTVADNASSGLFVLSNTEIPLADLDLTTLKMGLFQDGEQVSTGTGADCLGDPVNAVRWLARTAASLGDPLRAGEVVLSGALGPMVAVKPGAQYTARIDVLGSVSVSFEQAMGEN